NYNFPSRLNITVLFAAALFLAAAFFVTYSESNESDAANIVNTWNCGSGGSSDSSVTATLMDDGVLTISGTGSMASYGGYDQPWYSVRTSITSIIIESGVTSISTGAFDGCTNLTSVVIPDGVESIGYYTFQKCTGLTSVTIPSSVISIGYGAFSDCTGLTSIVIPDSVTLNSNAFYDCSNLKTVTVTGAYTSGGITDTYFKTNMAWKLPGMPYTVGCLFLPDVGSSDASHNTSYIGGSNGGTLLYSDGAYTRTGGSWVQAQTYSVSGKLTVIGGSASAENQTVTMTASGSSYGPVVYTVKTDGDGNYAITHVLHETSGSITAAISGYSQTVSPVHIGSLTGSLTGQDLTFTALYTVSGTLTVTGGESNVGVEVYLGTLHATTTTGGAYTITGVLHGTSGSITASITGYTQTVQASVTAIAADAAGKNITLTALYTVSLTKGDGISGFEYSINDDGTFDYEEPFETKHGDTLTVTAITSDGYAFVFWSGSSDSRANPLTVSVSGPVNLTANGELIEHYVTFGSGSNYTVYANGSPVSSPIRVAGGGSLSFTVQTSEGYSAVPAVSGIANLIRQSDGFYVILNVHSNISVTITVSADSGSEGENSSENNPDANSGNSSGSEGDSADGVSYWVPVLIVTALLVCIAAAAAGHTVLKRRRE
ncbi:MAG: leucine-rich repeat domain-containing protein, partial [Candidatus Methanoplasma sp.]|nr:leucine-rich repeat domain-containing protein [Candidatus Methanoplasma sp.]